MASKSSPKITTLRARYAACAIRYNKLAELAHKHTGAAADFFKPRFFATFYERDRYNITFDEIADMLVDYLSAPETALNNKTVRFFEDLAECSEITIFPLLEILDRDINKILWQQREERTDLNKKAYIGCLHNAKIWLHTLNTMAQSKYFFTKWPDIQKQFEEYLPDARIKLEDLIERAATELAKPIFSLTRNEVAACDQELKIPAMLFYVHMYLDPSWMENRMPDCLNGKPIPTAKNKVGALQKRATDCIKRYRIFSKQVEEQIKEINYSYDLLKKHGLVDAITLHAAAVHEYIDAAIIRAAKGNYDDASLEEAEQMLLIHQEQFEPWGLLAKIFSSKVRHNTADNEKSKREYCLEHVMYASNLLNRIDTLCNGCNYVPVQKSVEQFSANAYGIRERVEAMVEQTTKEIQKPYVTVSPEELVKWHEMLVELTARYVKEIVGELAFSKVPTIFFEKSKGRENAAIDSASLAGESTSPAQPNIVFH